MKNRKPNRLKGYDYSLSGFYFVTINIKDSLPVFGNVFNGKMVLNKFGEIAQRCWDEIPDHFPNVNIGEYIIMPDHIHGIIEIPVGVGHARPLREFARPLRERIRGLPIIIGSFKSAVTKYINRIDIKNNFKWQRSFHDRIIRDENEYYKIKNYIKNNTKNWNLK